MRNREINLTDAQREAIREYLALKARVRNPEGSFDKAGRFYPSQKYECCSAVRPPTRNWPYSLVLHCRTAEHVAWAHGVDPKIVRSKRAQMIAAFEDRLDAAILT